MNIKIDVEDKTYFEAKKILDEIGLEVSSYVKMCLKKLTKVKNITFLLDDITTSNILVQDNNLTATKNDAGKMTKTKAAALFRNAGYKVYKNLTFASKNVSKDYFWANPRYDSLKETWNIILNDWRENILYLFEIKTGSVRKADLLPRRDKEEFIDLQILVDDPTFTDRRSGVSFIKYLVAKVDY